MNTKGSSLSSFGTPETDSRPFRSTGPSIEIDTAYCLLLVKVCFAAHELPQGQWTLGSGQWTVDTREGSQSPPSSLIEETCARAAGTTKARRPSIRRTSPHSLFREPMAPWRILGLMEGAGLMAWLCVKNV